MNIISFFFKHLPFFQFCTILGGALIPFTFISIWEMTHSLNAATLSSALVLFGNFFKILKMYYYDFKLLLIQMLER